ncbi:response regulator [Paenarthrobacter sp. DKR-5]|uniref:response regulator n=1 Tax=Paenarthrobacter sp. DKR-5 TaxID=2835535 RepID=UPI0027DD6ACF|nr:response regulator [Paenarthrobacter sp. DKR-5]
MNPQAQTPGIRVLVVEDEEIAAAAHSEYVRRVDGFDLAGVARTGQDALRQLGDASAAGSPVDLVLLDMNLPDLHGLDVSRRIRSAGLGTDIIAITAVRELQVVRSAISTGIVQYLIKPFTFATFAEKLGNYLEFRRALESQPNVTSQSDVDLALAQLRTPGEPVLPKGLAEDTLQSVIELLKARGGPVSASEVVLDLGMSRVTARRYLEYLADAGRARRAPRYGTPGRPENEYSWLR